MVADTKQEVFLVHVVHALGQEIVFASERLELLKVRGDGRRVASKHSLLVEVGREASRKFR